VASEKKQRSARREGREERERKREREGEQAEIESAERGKPPSGQLNEVLS